MSNEELLEIAHGLGYDGEGLSSLYQWSLENKVQVTEEMLEAYEEGYLHCPIRKCLYVNDLRHF